MLKNLKHSHKIILMLLMFTGMFVLLFMRPPISQDVKYHGFADEVILFGIPHFFDVVSNFIFLVVGWFGVTEALKHEQLIARKSWILFFLSIFLIGPGSAYYHWNPNNDTLVWDRLPMGAGFMVLYLILLVEHVSLSLEKYLIHFLLTGIASVLIWAIWDDLRFYFWVQFSSFLCIPLILLTFESKYKLKSGYYFCLLFYFLAKVTETFDHQISAFTSHFVTGHTLKHLLAGVGLWYLVLMIKARHAANNSESYS